MAKNKSDFYAEDWRKLRFGVFDTETTGFSPQKDRIVEFGMIIFENMRPVERYDRLISHGKVKMSPGAQKAHGIDPEKLKTKKPFSKRAKKIAKLLESCDFLVAHNEVFDRQFLLAEFKRNNVDITLPPIIDTMIWSRFLWIGASKHTLDELVHRSGAKLEKSMAKELGIKVSRHRADYDAVLTGLAFIKMSSSMPRSLRQLLYVQEYIYLYWLTYRKSGGRKFARKVPCDLPPEAKK